MCCFMDIAMIQDFSTQPYPYPFFFEKSPKSISKIFRSTILSIWAILRVGF